MTDPILFLAPVLLWTIAVGLLRLLRDPSPVDSLLVLLLLGTTGMGLALLLATGEHALVGALDLALAFALLASVVGVAFLLYSRNIDDSSEDVP